MYILELSQETTDVTIGAFRTIEEGRAFLAQIETYESREEDGFVYEYLYPEAWAPYAEISYKGHIVPLSRFMFPEKERVEVIWKQVPDLSLPGEGMVKGATRVDAYCIDNKDLKEYIKTREDTYRAVKTYLETQGFEVDRAFFGSEDGEAVLYRRGESEDWHFLTHMDPDFCQIEDAESFVDALINEEPEA